MLRSSSALTKYTNAHLLLLCRRLVWVATKAPLSSHTILLAYHLSVEVADEDEIGCPLEANGECGKCIEDVQLYVGVLA